MKSKATLIHIVMQGWQVVDWLYKSANKIWLDVLNMVKKSSSNAHKFWLVELIIKTNKQIFVMSWDEYFNSLIENNIKYIVI